MVPGNGVEDWVGVSKVDAVNASGHGSGDREWVVDRVFRHQSEVSSKLDSGVDGDQGQAEGVEREGQTGKGV